MRFPNKYYVTPAVVLAGLACLSGCAFDTSNVLTGGEVPGTVDASIGQGAPDAVDAVDASDGAEVPCELGTLNLCSVVNPPDKPHLLIGDFDTDDPDGDNGCREFYESGGPETCLLYLEDFTLPEGETLRVFGSRPLIVATTGTIEIHGTVDISSQLGGVTGPGANNQNCSSMPPEDDGGGGGGGAGGSFSGSGGGGGKGDNLALFSGDADGGVSGAVATNPTFARGGCPGGKGGDSPHMLINDGIGGSGGASGGAVAFVAGQTFRLFDTGAIYASGGGGGLGGDNGGGGGGGGSGGFIRIEGSVVVIEGNVDANGGGGGSGGTLLSEGGNGADGRGNNSASGGSAPTFAGDGGAGSNQLVREGEFGTGGADGGGGGGGGAGYILVHGTISVQLDDERISPPVEQF